MEMRQAPTSAAQRGGIAQLTRCPRCGSSACGTFTCRVCGMRQKRKAAVFIVLFVTAVGAVALALF